MRCSATIAWVTALLAAAAPAEAQRLNVGDPAPPLAISQWLKGEAQTIGKDSKIYVLEFWATWCLPCIQDIPKLSKLQEQYSSDGVVIIGVTSPGSRGQKLDEVKRFLEQRGDQISYTIAWDQTDAMSRDYMMAVGATGIPYTFIVGKDGKLAWHGYSATPDFGRVLDELAAETFDAAKEAQRAQNDARIQEKLPLYAMEARAGNWDAALKILNEVVEIDAARFNPVKEAYFIHAHKLEDQARLRIWLESFIQKYKDNADALVNLSTVLMGIEEPGDRLPDLLLQAARGARDAAKGKNIDAYVIYARAAHRIGHLDEAVSAQTQALEMAPRSRRPALTRTLEYYQSCKQLRDTKF